MVAGLARRQGTGVAAPILIGTASWTDHVPFYPRGVSGPDRLEWYARHFPMVEVDSSFYRIPPARVTAAWVRRTPPGFVMNVKAHRTMTLHERRDGRPVPPSAQDLEWFEAALSPLREGGRLGAILYQWPPWFTASPANMEELLTVRERHPRDRVAVEFRHRSWGEPQVFHTLTDLLGEAGITYCAVDEPQVGSGSMAPLLATTTSGLAMLRLHGRNRRTWYRRVERTGERFDWWYDRRELEEIADRVRQLAREAAEVHVVINTNRGNQGPVNGLALAEILALPFADSSFLGELRAAAAAVGELGLESGEGGDPEGGGEPDTP